MLLFSSDRLLICAPENDCVIFHSRSPSHSNAMIKICVNPVEVSVFSQRQKGANTLEKNLTLRAVLNRNVTVTCDWNHRFSFG